MAHGLLGQIIANTLNVYNKSGEGFWATPLYLGPIITTRATISYTRCAFTSADSPPAGAGYICVT